MSFFDADSLKSAIEKLRGTADHMLKIWFTLKQMGMTEHHPVKVTTFSPTEALKRLFSYGHPEGKFFVPFAHTARFMTMQTDAARSIIQTNIVRWVDSGSVVGTDPTDYLDIVRSGNDVIVKPGRKYPFGLGLGKLGFALDDDSRVSIPDVSFAVWYYRQHEFGDSVTIPDLLKKLEEDLKLSGQEFDLIFVNDRDWEPTFQEDSLTDADIYAIVSSAIENSSSAKYRASFLLQETYGKYSTRIKSMITVSDRPKWLYHDPVHRLQKLIEEGCKAILLYGPPRTGKTRAIDRIISRTSVDRETIQIHDGWGYDELMVGLRPDGNMWRYIKGPLLQAINTRKKTIVLEEINRTQFTQAIGEVFSLIEESYRGESHGIRLRNNDFFFIPAETLIICTMNTIDKSTEDIDDALFGRLAAIEFKPRVEDLHNILRSNNISPEIAEKLRELFSSILEYYPLRHGYWAAFNNGSDPISFYVTRIRPVLQAHLEGYRDEDLANIDEKVDHLFG